MSCSTFASTASGVQPPHGRRMSSATVHSSATIFVPPSPPVINPGLQVIRVKRRATSAFGKMAAIASSEFPTSAFIIASGAYSRSVTAIMR